jgi:hypothetical protein
MTSEVKLVARSLRFLTCGVIDLGPVQANADAGLWFELETQRNFEVEHAQD